MLVPEVLLDVGANPLNLVLGAGGCGEGITSDTSTAITLLLTCGGRHRELTSARSEIHDLLRLIEAQFDEKLDFLRCPGILLAVVLAGMDRIEVLPTSGSQLIEHPTRLARNSLL